MHKGYKCLDRTTGRIYISRDVVFDESVFPFATPGVSVDVSTLEQAIRFPSDEPVISEPVRNYDLSYLSIDPSVPSVVVSSQVSDACHGSSLESDDGAATGVHSAPVHVVIDVHGAPMRAPEPSCISKPSRHPEPSVPALGASVGQPTSPYAASPAAATSSADPIVNQHAMVTRHRDQTRREKTYTDGTVRYDPRRRAFFAAPTSHRDALREPAWQSAMSAEFDALQQNGTRGFLSHGRLVSILWAASGSLKRSIVRMDPLTSIKRS
jgi:hypothetical protein